MYLFGLSAVYAIAYLALSFGLPLFFTGTIFKPRFSIIKSIALVVVVYFFVLVCSFFVPGADLSNRFLHAFGGGSMVVLICFLALKDSETKISGFQFFVISILLATMFGVANEIFEYILQNYFDFSFADSINDTWLDLISNTVGAVLAGLVLLPFLRKIRQNL